MDREGYLADDEVIADGDVWVVKDCTGQGLLCEEYADEETECPEEATVELKHYHEDGHCWRCLCEKHFEEFKGK